jgi:DNA polymerase-1
MNKQDEQPDTKPEETKRLVLLDAHAILHRAYHALPDFTSDEGEPTGALYGLCTMLLSIIDELDPDYLAACYDLPGDTHRDEMYDEYKAGREAPDDALVAQIQRSRDLLDTFSIDWYEEEGFEADDLLGTIAEQMNGRDDVEVIIASGDYDTLQLVDDKRVRVYALRKGIKDTVLFDEAGVHERFGFDPEYLPDYKGLRGDSSDNIPGIDGIGEVTATKIICTYGHLADIYEALAKKDEAVFQDEADITARFYNLLKDNKDEAFFSKELGMIRTDAPIDFSLPTDPWQDTFDISAAVSLFNTLDFNNLTDRIKDTFGEDDISTEDEQQSLFEKKESVDEETLHNTQVALWLCDSTITDPDFEDILEYADTDTFADAKSVIFSELEAKGLYQVYEDIEKPLIPVVEKMNRRGIRIDTDYLEKLSEKYHDELSEIEQRIFEHAGEEFNMNSPKQLREVLFEQLGLPRSHINTTSTGKLSTAESELKKLHGKHPIIDDIFAYRKLQKLLSTYIDAIHDQVAEDGRLYATFVQTGTTTGRMSSTDPNLQNIPISSDRGRKIRDSFVPAESFTLAAFDYSQIELRIAAMLSQDEKLMRVFTNDEDIHAAVAVEMFDVDHDDVTKNMRRKAKVINFGILYGMGVQALRKNLGEDTSMEEAQTFYDRYFDRFEGLAEYIEETKKRARKHGFTETIFGRKRYFKQIDSKVDYIRKQAEREAINAPIQGSQADIIKKASVDIDNWLTQNNIQDDVHLLLQIHDELVFEVRTDMHKEIVPEIKHIMESVVPPEDTGGIVFVAEPEIGPNLGALQPYNNDQTN